MIRKIGMECARLDCVLCSISGEVLVFIVSNPRHDDDSDIDVVIRLMECKLMITIQ